MFNLRLIEKVGYMDFDNAVTQISTDLDFSKGTESSMFGKPKS